MLRSESVVYIDELIGTNELSVRTQKLSHLTVAHDFKAFKVSLGKSRILYQFEKEQAKQIYKLSIAYFDLVNLLDSKHDVKLPCIQSSLLELLAMVDHLLDGPKDWRELVCVIVHCLQSKIVYSHVHYILFVIVENCFRCHMSTLRIHMAWGMLMMRVKTARYMSEAKFSKMQSKLVEQVTPVQTVAKALFKCIDADHDHLKDKHSQQVTSFLFIGLTSICQRQLVDYLSKYLVADVG